MNHKHGKSCEWRVGQEIPWGVNLRLVRGCSPHLTNFPTILYVKSIDTLLYRLTNSIFGNDLFLL